ncbi:MAG TPA: hypothetical protein VL197_10800 [Nitrospirota bacterium]|nr:hypothetical protein [Nitrospirota bacterium]
METLPLKCAKVNAVGSFCDCVAGEETAGPAAEAFCSRAKTDNSITSEDLGELKMALMDLEEGACCDC